MMLANAGDTVHRAWTRGDHFHLYVNFRRMRFLEWIPCLQFRRFSLCNRPVSRLRSQQRAPQVLASPWLSISFRFVVQLHIGCTWYHRSHACGPCIHNSQSHARWTEHPRFLAVPVVEVRMSYGEMRSSSKSFRMRLPYPLRHHALLQGFPVAAFPIRATRWYPRLRMHIRSHMRSPRGFRRRVDIRHVHDSSPEQVASPSWTTP